MCLISVNGTLKSRNSQRVKFPATREMMIGYFSYAPTELISRHVALEVSLEQFHYQRSFSAVPTATVGEVPRCKDSDENRSPYDATECTTVHRPRFHVAGLLTGGGVLP
jgi:hypothetical protein